MSCKCVVDRAEYCPCAGVKLTEGLLSEVFEHNQQYLLQHFTLDDMLYPFQTRAGKKAVRNRPLVPFWETDLEGSNAGRFLMGAGKTLCFADNPAIKEKLDNLLRGIFECAEEDGYCMGFTKEDMMILERANYTRSWLTRGLLAAGESGAVLANTIVRNFQDWFNNYPHRRKAAELHLAYQGMISDMEVALSPVGCQKDWENSKELYALEDWIQDLLCNKTETVWKRPNDGAHGYELNAMIAYLELYMLSGERKYYDAVCAAWEMFKKYWIHIGGSVAICEEHDAIFNYTPGSRHVTADWHTGETCNNVWWIILNSLLLQLNPNEEKYAAEIEKSIYNVLVPAQEKDKGIRYHANLHGQKDSAYTENTCCEGTGTLLYGMLPSLIYHLHLNDAGATIELFASSKLEQDGYQIRMQTDFPNNDDVEITVSTDDAIQFPLRIRIPSWVSENIEIYCDGIHLETGCPGTYVTIDRMWKGETHIAFTLKREITAIRYVGFSTVLGYERYAFMHGPILMAVTGESKVFDDHAIGWCDKHPDDPRSKWNRTHWVLDVDPQRIDPYWLATHCKLKPYYLVGSTEEFTCYPLVKQTSTSHKISPEESFRTGLRRRIKCGEISVDLLGIPAGTYLMGQENYEPCERPVHEERIEKAFFIGVFPITQAQYHTIMGYNPSNNKNEECPVEMVSFGDAQEFIQRLNRMQDDVCFRLPTEAEWEYACRADSRDINGYSTDVLRDFAQYMWNYQQLGYQSVETGALPTSHPVGKKLPNTWGLYDMLGNVGEWCADIYRSYNPNGFVEPGLRVIRGGSYNDLATYCRCATRNALEPEWKNRFTGFRVAADYKL